MRRPIATVLLIALALTGCHKWVEVESLHRDGGKDASVIRVTRTNGTVFRLYGPSVQSDSLVGSLYEPGQRRPPNAQRRFALAMESVERMEIRTADPAATVGLALATAGFISLITIHMRANFTPLD